MRCATPSASRCASWAESLKNITEPIEVFAIEINGPPLPVSTELPPVPSELTHPSREASVAVLPLANLSNDARNSHLCDGFTGDIITNLSRFRDLLVIARHSAFLFQAPRPRRPRRSPASSGSATS